jgi:pimeloyl-ACP methyl ester carboxylesterase
LSAYGKIHEGSINNITGGDQEIRKIMDIPSMVNKNTPPAFIWATSNDACVPVESSLLMAWAYRKYEIPVELHIFEDGNHGLSLANKEVKSINVPVQKWVELSHTWLNNRGFIVKEKGE